MTIKELNSYQSITKQIDIFNNLIQQETDSETKAKFAGECKKLIEQRKHIVSYINDIADNDIKTIFLLRFIQKQKLEDIGAVLHYSGKTISRRIESYIKNH